MRKRRRASPQTRLAVEALSRIVREHIEAGAHFLPSLRELVGRLDVSRATVYKALKLLERGGTLKLVPRRGIQILRTPAHDAPGSKLLRPVSDDFETDTTARWQEVRGRLAADLVNFTFPPGHVLPSLKELCVRYGTCRRTLVQALRSLVDDAKLERYKSGYRVQRIRHTVTSNAIVLFQAYNEPAGIEQFLPHVEEYWRCLENECTLLGMHLHVHLLPMRVPGENRYATIVQSVREVEDSYTVAGYIIPTVSCPQHTFAPLLQVIGAGGKPVAVIAGSTIDPSTVWHNYPSARVFNLGCGTQAGEHVGRLLLGLGHRSAAFLSAHTLPYGENVRFVGLCRAYKSVGLDDGVHGFDVPFSASEDAHFGTFIQKKHLETFRQGMAKHAKQFVKHYHLDSPHHLHVDRSALFYARLQLRSAPFRPMFAEALSHDDITAWVCYNDQLAFGALEYLAEQRVPVPERISVVGFDDTTESLARGLTSYNINVPAIMHAAVEYILAPAAERRRRHVVVDIPGRVMERSSTRSIVGQ